MPNGSNTGLNCPAGRYLGYYRATLTEGGTLRSTRKLTLAFAEPGLLNGQNANHWSKLLSTSAAKRDFTFTTDPSLLRGGSCHYCTG